MYICDVCNRTYLWQCLLKTSCCNATEREAIDANDSWACPGACINLNQNEKKSRSTFRKERLWKSHGTQPGSQKNYKTRVKASIEACKQSLNKFEEHIAAPDLSQPAPDEHLNDLQEINGCDPVLTMPCGRNVSLWVGGLDV